MDNCVRHDTFNSCVVDTSSSLDFPGGSDGKASVYDVGDPGSIPGFGRSLGEGNSNPLNHSCLENFMDRGAWQATVDEVANFGSLLPPHILN